MSWQEKIKSQIVIITGDRKRYTPQWKKALKKIEYNVASFNFPNVNGTLVQKREPQGAKYPIEIYFQGEDHLDIAEEFRKSAEDRRHWHILHPLYGDLRVQPSSFTFDNTSPNLTLITGVMLETLPNNFPNNTYSPQERVFEKKEATDLKIASGFVSNSPPATSTDIISLNQTVDVIAAESLNLVTTDEDFNKYTNKVEAAKRELDVATYEAAAAISKTQEMINFPSDVVKSVDQRVKAFTTQLTRLDSAIRSVSNIPKSLKVQFEALSNSIMGALSVVISTKESVEDYGTSKKVLATIDSTLATYNKLQDTLDFVQSDSAEELDSFIPDYDSNIALNDLVNYSVANLFEIAMNSKQERIILIEDDSDIISLTHRFLGLDVDDKNIDEFILNNEIGISEMLEIKKGRKITYFI